MAEISVAVAEGHQASEVAERLRAAGMSVSEVLPAIDVIVGTAPDGLVDRLAGIEGVEAVEVGGSVQLPRPDEPIQ